MSQSLSIINNAVLTNLDGSVVSVYQGTDPTLGIEDAFAFPGINGPGFLMPFQVATATAQKLYDSAVNIPAAFQYGFIKVNQPNCYLQIITAATNFEVGLTAGVPFIITPSMLAAAATTAISAAPTLAAVAKIYIYNNSGNLVNGLLFLVN